MEINGLQNCICSSWIEYLSSKLFVLFRGEMGSAPFVLQMQGYCEVKLEP